MTQSLPAKVAKGQSLEVWSKKRMRMQLPLMTGYLPIPLSMRMMMIKVDTMKMTTKNMSKRFAGFSWTEMMSPQLLVKLRKKISKSLRMTQNLKARKRWKIKNKRLR